MTVMVWKVAAKVKARMAVREIQRALPGMVRPLGKRDDQRHQPVLRIKK
jgi:hypothetical protein